MQAIGIDLGGTYIKAALVHKAFGLVRTNSVETGADKGKEHVLNQIEEVVKSLMRRRDRISGVGIGAPGSIDMDRKMIIKPANMPGWDVVDMRKILKKRLGKRLNIFVENDANAAALGSARYGAARNYDHFIMVTLGTGVGGAIVFNKRIFRGSTGAAGEVGHVTINYAGPPDLTGVNGAIEAYLGQRFLVGHAREHLEDFPESTLYVSPGLENLTPATITDAALNGDPGAISVLEWAGRKLGCFLGGVVNLLDIRTIVIGGGVSKAGDLLLKPAREIIPSYIVPGMQENVVLVQETLGNEAGMLGAACLVFDQLDDQNQK
ncbi:MAG: ROK family protein [Bacteroidetes bacterium]|nr:ROK family protein [Bacteroidota bacterium]MCY4234503.1 ROK family protein [Bacteroidota bacterium]